jgi:hypothetical protein
MLCFSAETSSPVLRNHTMSLDLSIFRSRFRVRFSSKSDAKFKEEKSFLDRPAEYRAVSRLGESNYGGLYGEDCEI